MQKSRFHCYLHAFLTFSTPKVPKTNGFSNIMYWNHGFSNISKSNISKAICFWYFWDAESEKSMYIAMKTCFLMKSVFSLFFKRGNPRGQVASPTRLIATWPVHS